MDELLWQQVLAILAGGTVPYLYPVIGPSVYTPSCMMTEKLSKAIPR